MRVQLEAIQFNYDRDLAITGAFTIRRSESRAVRIPEWQPDLSDDPQASPAAYAICELPKEMSIQARFKCDEGLNTPLLIRAIAEPSDHVLGSIEPQEIPITESPGFITFKLPHARVATAGVGIHDISWHWQFSDEPDVWTDVETTFHRIYTVLGRPSEPWEPECRNPANIHQPWTEVLEFGCVWAKDVKSDVDEAAKRVTKSFFELGENLISYQSNEQYAFETFDCTRFLKLLKTGVGAQTVNCDDCATVVSTFANILGCHLSQSGLGLFFSTNPVLLIGKDDFETIDFHFHSVAWKGLAMANDEVFDGCLQIDVDVAPPLIPEQPVDLQFGTMETGYRFSLVKGAPHVIPLPDHPNYGRRRRKLGSGYSGQLRITDERVINNLKKFYDFDSWPVPKEEPLHPRDDNKTISRILRQESFDEDWSWQSGKRFRDERFRNVFQIFLKPANGIRDGLLGINVYENKSANEANENLIQLLGRFEQLNLKRLSEPPVGDVAFADDRSTTVILRSGRSIVVVRSASRIPFSVMQFVSDLRKVFGPAVSE